MKRLIFIGVALALVVGMIWVPSVAAVSADIIIHKTIDEGCPEETFHFEAWRDKNGNGVIDAGDTLQGTVDITGAGKGVITVSIFGLYIIHELPVSGWEPHPDQIVMVSCDVHVYFHNRCGPCPGQIEILKFDEFGDPLFGASFEITPNPKTGAGSLTVVDNGANDEDPADGVLLVTEVQICVPVTVTEIEAPPGYELDPTPYPAHVTECGETVVVTVVNIPEEEYGQILILKEDPEGNALVGATFEITPDPKTGIGSLTVVDNGLNDELPLTDGQLLVTECLVCIPVTVTEIEAPDGYELDPTPQPAHITTAGETVTLTFVDTKCELTIYKVDGSGDPLAGACFTITPNPRTGADSLVLCDNGPEDECPADGVLCLSELICGLECTVEETTVPPGYQGADPQTVTIGETIELTFENTREMDCGTVCAAQTAPGEFLFSTRQTNWFTWIFYDIGSGTEADPYTYPIYTGQTTLCGTLYVYDDGTHIFVNYELTDLDGCTLGGLSVYHLQVDASFDDLYDNVVKGKNPVPGKCEYIDYFDPMVSETGYIECTDDDISGWDTAYIFAHGVGCYYCP